MILAVAMAAALAGPTQAEDCLQVKIREAYDAGWRFRATEVASLSGGQTHAVRATLLAGTRYRVLGCADSAAKNLDVLIYDADGAVLARDTTTDREPEVELQPTKTGAYFIVLYHRQAAQTGAEAGAALALGFR